MALSTMYEGKNNSPQTDITSNITAVDIVIPVTDITVFPAAPNLATIGNDENAEVIRYNGIDGSTLTGCERGFGGTTASPWSSSTVISRQITKYDIDTLRGNILDLESRKQNALTFDTTPTAGSSNPVTSGGIKTALDGKTPLASGVLRFINQSTSVTSSSAVFCTISNAAITEDHVLLDVTFTTPSNITSDVTWSTSNGTLTLQGINTSASNKVAVTLGLAGNI